MTSRLDEARLSVAPGGRPAAIKGARPFPPEAEPQPALNRLFDRIGSPREELLGCRAPSYLVLGVCGVAVAFVVLTGLGFRVGLPLVTSVILTIASLAVFVAAGLLRKAIVGRDRHVLLQDVLLVLVTGAAVARALGRPVLVVLDLHALALGAFLIFGRLGCLFSGCCHGRPSSVGVRYHADDPLAGVRLFPVQLVEALWTLLITAAGALFVLAREAPGIAASFWLVAYAAGRFVLELARGDIERARLGPLTEAQWTALLLVLCRVAYEEASRPSLDRAAISGIVLTAALAAIGYATRSRWLSLPEPDIWVDQMAAWQALLVELERTARRSTGSDAATAGSPTPGVSVEFLLDPADHGHEVHAFTLRRAAGALNDDLAFTLAGVVLQRLPSYQLLRAAFCDAGHFHIWALVAPSGPAGSTLQDDPRLLLYRARATARGVRSAPPPIQPPLVTDLDPRLLPPVEPPPAVAPGPHLPPPVEPLQVTTGRSPFERPFGLSTPGTGLALTRRSKPSDNEP